MRKAALGAAVFVAAAITVFGGQKASAQSTTKPEVKPKIVVVEPGDSLSKIARAHKTTYPRIFYANKNIEHPDKIFPDQKLRIPRAEEKLVKRPMPSDAQVPAHEPKQQAETPQARQSQSRVTWNPTPVAPVSVVGGSVWDRLAACESGGNWGINTGNGYYGGLQFSLATWRGVGGSGYPHQASRSEQIRRGQILQARSGWGQWPACTAKLGLR